MNEIKPKWHWRDYVGLVVIIVILLAIVWVCLKILGFIYCSGFMAPHGTTLQPLSPQPGCPGY